MSRERDVLRKFLSRQQRSLEPHVSCGRPLADNFNFDRWDRELAADLDWLVDEAHVINVQILEELSTALRFDYSLTAFRAAYGFLEARLTGAELTGDLHSTGGVGEHTVYKLYDGNERLMYVGITSRGPKRLVEHHKHKWWFGQVEQVEFEKFETRSQSAHREAELIKRYAPLYNIQHNQGRSQGSPPELAHLQSAQLANG